MRNFQPASGPQQRDILMQRIRRCLEDLKRECGPFIRPANILESGQLAAKQAETLQAFDAANATLAEVEGILQRARGALGAAGAQELSMHFKDQATNYERLARLMLRTATACAVALAVSIAALGGMADWLVTWVGLPPLAVEKTTDWAILARDAAPRLLVLAVLAYGVRFGVRNYSINKDLQETCRLRVAVLKTYDPLVKSMPDDDKMGRMGLLLAQATTAVDTGHRKAGEDHGLDGSVLALAELLKKG